jgi:hypothetical protein
LHSNRSQHNFFAKKITDAYSSPGWT